MLFENSLSDEMGRDVTLVKMHQYWIVNGHLKNIGLLAH